MVARFGLTVWAASCFLRGFQVFADDADSDPRTTPYEYIVVGSGAGGGVAAARLALKGHKTLLVEAGDDQGENVNQIVPGYHPLSTEDPSQSWDFFVKHYSNPKQASRDSKLTWSTPSGKDFIGQSGPKGAVQKGIFYPRASTLGGCTAHNAMVHVYPTNSDWQHIEKLTGDSSWAPNNMRKYLELIEKCGYIPKGTPGHGSEGWLGVNIPDSKLSANDVQILQIGLEAGIAMKQIQNGTLQERQVDLGRVLRSDLNSPSPDRDFKEGMYQIPLDMENGRRTGSRNFVISVSTARHANGSKKYPLDVRLNSHVTRVLFEPGRKEKKLKPLAIGVEYLEGKQLYKASPGANANKPKPQIKNVYARKEVILSAGAFNTPQILKLSGIGPQEELAKFNIPLQAHLPGVGTNLQDHFEIGVTHETQKPFAVSALCTFDGPTDPCFQLWKNNLTGPLASSNGFPFALLQRTSVAPTKEPDIFIFGGATKFRGYYRGYSKGSYVHQAWTWVVLRAHTENRAGTVKLLSANPLDTPEIHFHYFNDGDTKNGEDTRDLQAMTEAIELARRVSNAGPGVKPAAKSPFAREVIPGEKVDGKAALAQYIKDESWSHHASCTCAIGADGDKMAVLDSEFRVRGVEGLRVADASVFPRIPGYFVVLPTYIIGEKAADVISSGSRR